MATKKCVSQGPKAISDIAIIPRDVGDSHIQTINARELHEFLGNKDHFSTWIKDRISQYGFLENQDFIIFSENSEKGRPAIEFHITLNMAKELCMVERNDKGKEARQYFIECERKLKEITVPQPVPTISLTPEEQTLAAYDFAMQMAERLKLPEYYAMAEAVRFAKEQTGIDFSEFLKFSALRNNTKDDKMLSPADLGRLFFSCSEQAMNERLAKSGLQVRMPSGWQPTPKALLLGMCAVFEWTHKGEQDYRLMWDIIKVKEHIH